MNIDKYGYRLDYILIRDDYVHLLKDSGILKNKVTSDHIPIYVKILKSFKTPRLIT